MDRCVPGELRTRCVLIGTPADESLSVKPVFPTLCCLCVFRREDHHHTVLGFKVTCVRAYSSLNPELKHQPFFTRTRVGVEC